MSTSNLASGYQIFNTLLYGIYCGYRGAGWVLCRVHEISVCLGTWVFNCKIKYSNIIIRTWKLRVTNRWITKLSKQNRTSTQYWIFFGSNVWPFFLFACILYLYVFNWVLQFYYISILVQKRTYIVHLQTFDVFKFCAFAEILSTQIVRIVMTGWQKLMIL